MLSSMTGYGKATTTLSDGRTLSVEVKSLNGKGLDLSVKLPRIFTNLEFSLRQKAQVRIDRGKASITIWWSTQQEQSEPAENPGVEKLRTLIHGLLELSKELNLAPELLLPQSASFLPFIQSDAQENVPTEEEMECFNSTVESGFLAFDQYRHAEGEALDQMFRTAILEILSLLEQIKPFEEERASIVRNRLTNALERSELLASFDADRFEQELIFYLEKQDFSEETHRLTQNLHYFLEALSEDKTSGKKLGFIAQEIGREINTLGSKCQDARIQKLVVLMKNELEKIKEQILNVL